jgi:hypothetical protein
MKTAIQIGVLLLLVATAGAERKRDPLTEAEADQFRDVRMEPYQRLKLFTKFAEARLDSIDKLQADPKEAEGRGRKIHDVLEDFTAVLDELNSNLDTYEAEPMDKEHDKQFHKGLKEVILAGDRFHARLRALKNAAQNDPVTGREAKEYMFALQDAQEALQSTVDMAREYAEVKKDAPAENKK